MARDIRLHIDAELCRSCRKCLAARVCSVRAIVAIDPGEPPYVDVQRCYDCRKCLPACPFNAISMGNNGA
jgi:Fe-S-cluster-containing hydrogenase component 2